MGKERGITIQIQYPIVIGAGTCGCDGTISYTTQQMNVNEVQTLTVTGESHHGCTEYTWEILSGGGSLSTGIGMSTNYTAPATNYNCNNNPVIVLKCMDLQVDTLSIAVNQVAANTIAYWTSTGCAQDNASCDGDPCPATRWCCRYYKWDCSGAATGDGSPASGRPCVWRYSDQPGCEAAYQCRSVGPHDVRTEQMKSDGCCPFQLI